jgi:predicted nucleic acid-binding protein
MAQPLAVVDTDLLVLLLTDTASLPVETRLRQERAELSVRDLDEQGARWVVPAPSVAELQGLAPDTPSFRRVLARLFRRVRVEAVTVEVAAVAGVMCREVLKRRGPGETRGAVQFDALVAATAHVLGARWLVTDNARDLRRHLRVVQSPVELLVASEIPQKGQLHFLHAARGA